MSDKMLTEILSRLDAAFATYAPQVTDLALTSVRITALRNFIAALLGVVFVVVAIKYLVRWWKVKMDPLDDVEMVRVMGTIFGGIGLAIIGSISITMLIDPWLYIALANPKLYLAKQIMDTVLHR
jgi:hypothetical protein